MRLKIIGWKYGFRKIQFSELLKEYSAMSLSTAKATTDKILENEIVILSIPDQKAQQFIALAAEIGAIVEQF